MKIQAKFILGLSAGMMGVAGLAQAADLIVAGAPRQVLPTREVLADLDLVNPAALRLAIEDLAQDYPQQYAGAVGWLKEADDFAGRLTAIRAGVAAGDGVALREAGELLALQRRALLANPLLDFQKLLLIKRKPVGDARRRQGGPDTDKGLGKFLGVPQQSSWQLHAIEKTDGWDNEIVVLDGLSGDGDFKTVYRPEQGRLINEVDLHFDGDRMMFSMPDEKGLWQIHEIGVDGGGLRRISGNGQPGVHNLDSCYLPNGKIAYISTAPLQGVPCNASINVGMMYLMDGDGGNIRQLCFEQDHNFSPTVMNDGRILYLRWEYTDLPHVWARYLFTMNPDGTNQHEFYGSGGYWPNAIFYTRPVPNHPTMVAGIVTGHHVGRVGDLVVFDPAQGRRNADGVVQRIPGRGKKVEPLIQDKLTLDTYPKFLHPWPLSEKYFLVTCKPRQDDLWGIYLVDVFDNMLCLRELEDYALLEPIPLRAVPRPPVIPDMVDPSRKDAIIYLQDIHTGPGLAGVPLGAVKQLRLFTYHFAYQKLAGIDHRVGVDGPWEPKRILGTVPVEADGSAIFRVPANTPISIQPLDENGGALQLMRSWTTAMPGEVVSCIGCHQQQNAAPPPQPSLASQKPPGEIKPWYGPVRGFSFRHEVQPVLDRHCVSCHDGAARDDGRQIPDLRADQGRFVTVKGGNPAMTVISGKPREELLGRYAGVFDPSYIELRRHVRVGGFESDLLLNPREFHVSTSPLFQMLRKGHHGVQLGTEDWDRLTAWVDLNTPCHGTWKDVVGIGPTLKDHDRRLEMRKLYGGDVSDPEAEVAACAPVTPVAPRRVDETPPTAPALAGWPISAERAQAMQAELGETRRSLDLGDGVKLELVRIPAGRFVMGDPQGHPDEWPLCEVAVGESFWMGRCEVSNEQYQRFDPAHDSRLEHKGSWIFSENHLGWPLNRPGQPVVRVSWDEAREFCRWLSVRTGLSVTLPGEAQWEWACRAGTSTALHYGGLDQDFSPFANLADVTIRDYAYDTDGRHTVDLLPRDSRFNDKQLVTTETGSYQANAWGLCDMHGNAWEWTCSKYAPYPYRADDGRNGEQSGGERVVRGGSWYDRPARSRSGFRLSYEPWQKVFNVGFRVVVKEVGTSR